MKAVKKILVMIPLSLALLLAACSSKEPEIMADFESPSDAAWACKFGDNNLVGKTVKVKANMENSAGVIYMMPDTTVRANVYVTIITDDSNRSEVLGIKSGDTVVITVDSADNHLENSVYLFAKEYTLAK
ncbi:MAG: hypothetical protein K5776_07155 [Lachnospiraceae bacterium]|nr:hypothetical protein [Lachnospiraceae bacterium]